MIDLHTEHLLKFAESHFYDLKQKRGEIINRLKNAENDFKLKSEFIDELTDQIKNKNEGVLVEDKLEQVNQVHQWAKQQINMLENQNNFEDLNQKINLDANLIVKNPTELQEAIYEDEEIISTCVVFFGEFSKIIGYRPDIDYWFTAKSDMEATDSLKQFSYMEGAQCSLVFHNKLIFTGIF